MLICLRPANRGTTARQGKLKSDVRQLPSDLSVGCWMLSVGRLLFRSPPMSDVQPSPSPFMELRRDERLPLGKPRSDL